MFDMYTVVKTVDEIKTRCPKCEKNLRGTWSSKYHIYAVWCNTPSCKLWGDIYFVMR